MPTKRARTKTSVAVQYAVPRRGLPSAASFRRWIASFSNITIRIVGEAEGRRLNRTFRKKSRATNVLSFDTGDVVLCAPVIRREARAQKKPLAAHYAHLAIHGALHLRGYDHRKKREAERMEAREIALLRRLKIGNPYTVE